MNKLRHPTPVALRRLISARLLAGVGGVAFAQPVARAGTLTMGRPLGHMRKPGKGSITPACHFVMLDQPAGCRRTSDDFQPLL